MISADFASFGAADKKPESTEIMSIPNPSKINEHLKNNNQQYEKGAKRGTGSL